MSNTTYSLITKIFRSRRTQKLKFEIFSQVNCVSKCELRKDIKKNNKLLNDLKPRKKPCGFN